MRATTKLSEKFQIAETTTFAKKMSKDKSLLKIYKKIRDYVYPVLRRNPYFDPNVKRLKGEWS
jgi:mRNA interferase RelE/StbE